MPTIKELLKMSSKKKESRIDKAVALLEKKFPGMSFVLIGVQDNTNDVSSYTRLSNVNPVQVLNINKAACSLIENLTQHVQNCMSTPSSVKEGNKG